MDMVRSDCPCVSSQLQAQVATLCREVTQLQRQRERSLEKESFRAKVVKSYPLPRGTSLGVTYSGPSGPTWVPGVGVGHSFSGPCPDPSPCPQDHPHHL